jgi:hypothetical protein
MGFTWLIQFLLLDILFSVDRRGSLVGFPFESGSGSGSGSGRLG